MSRGRARFNDAWGELTRDSYDEVCPTTPS
jgi:hypothetical protein